ncbi:hypothetical protein V1294_002762 [Bradyrhizobium sp. AZCC 1678]
MPGVRGEYTGPTPGVCWQTAALVASIWALCSHSPGLKIRAAMRNAIQIEGASIAYQVR